MSVTASHQVTEQEVMEAVRRLIKDQHPGGAVLEVVPDGIWQEQDWWHVAVRPDRQPAKRFEYYEALAEVELALLKSENLTVLLVPLVPEGGLAAA